MQHVVMLSAWAHTKHRITVTEKNTIKCTSMHTDAQECVWEKTWKKQHHFGGKTTLHPRQPLSSGSVWEGQNLAPPQPLAD